MTGAIIGAYIENMGADSFNHNVNINLTGSLLLKITFSEQLKQNAHFSTFTQIATAHIIKLFVYQTQKRQKYKAKIQERSNNVLSF